MAREPTRILVPAYQYPSHPPDVPQAAWRVLQESGPKVPIGRFLVIANPDNGPGVTRNRDQYTDRDQNYAGDINGLRKNCVSVAGYVTDCYDNTKVNCPRSKPIEEDIDRWFDIYNINGMFIDEVDRDNVDRAEELVQIVRQRSWGATIVLNPGTVPSRQFMVRTDPAIVVVHENAFAAYEGWPAPNADIAAWLRARDGGSPTAPGYIPAKRLAIIAHTPAALTEQQALDRLIGVASRYDIDWVYAWHGVGSIYNPLSTYLPELTTRIASRMAGSELIRNISRPLWCRLSQTTDQVVLGRSQRSGG